MTRPTQRHTTDATAQETAMTSGHHHDQQLDDERVLADYLADQAGFDGARTNAPGPAGWEPDPTPPLWALSGRELMARGEHSVQIAHADSTASSAERAAALAELDIVWAEAERRAADRPAESVEAGLAGYLALLREDID